MAHPPAKIDVGEGYNPWLQAVCMPYPAFPGGVNHDVAAACETHRPPEDGNELLLVHVTIDLRDVKHPALSRRANAMR
jgi:hypothetical protein